MTPLVFFLHVYNLSYITLSQFKSSVRNMSRSSSSHLLVSDVLVVLVSGCGEVIHSASNANVILAWATFLAKSLIHDAALSFYNVWISLIDNFAATKSYFFVFKFLKFQWSFHFRRSFGSASSKTDFVWFWTYFN